MIQGYVFASLSRATGLVMAAVASGGSLRGPPASLGAAATARTEKSVSVIRCWDDVPRR